MKKKGEKLFQAENGELILAAPFRGEDSA